MTHLDKVRALPCGVCGAPPPSFAHHIREGRGLSQKAPDALAVPLCYECHQGDEGWHGSKALWRVRKLDELDVLAATIEKLLRR